MALWQRRTALWGEGRAFEAAGFVVAALVVAAAGAVPLMRAAHVAAEASALQRAVLTARMIAYSAERHQLKEVARLRKAVAADAGGQIREIAVVAEPSDERYPALSGRRYLSHSDPSKGSAVLDSADAADVSAGEAGRTVTDSFQQRRSSVRLPAGAAEVRVGAPVVVAGRPAASVLVTVALPPVTDYIPAGSMTAAPLLATAVFLAVLLFFPAWRHAAAAASLLALWGFALSGREALSEINLTLVAERAYLLSAGHNRFSAGVTDRPGAGEFLARIQKDDARPFLSMTRSEAPFSGPGPLAQLKKGGRFSVPIPGFRASYAFTIDDAAVAEISAGGRPAHLRWTLGGLAAAALIYFAAAITGAPRHAGVARCSRAGQRKSAQGPEN
jgi:hypothetical protein